MKQTDLSPVEQVFYWWGRLCAHGESKGSYPTRTSNFIAYVAPKLKAMGFTIAEQVVMLSAYLKGVYTIFKREVKQDLEDE